mmetsp:Transcript_32965/g.97920  ORF Transcript_32965/g.97920 Transcript_32965/m.97920 type:complete len:366 (+) Transcript_32965:682-1779(+)
MAAFAASPGDIWRLSRRPSSISARSGGIWRSLRARPTWSSRWSSRSPPAGVLTPVAPSMRFSCVLVGAPAPLRSAGGATVVPGTCGFRGGLACAAASFSALPPRPRPSADGGLHITRPPGVGMERVCGHGLRPPTLCEARLGPPRGDRAASEAGSSRGLAASFALLARPQPARRLALYCSSSARTASSALAAASRALAASWFSFAALRRRHQCCRQRAAATARARACRRSASAALFAALWASQRRITARVAWPRYEACSRTAAVRSLRNPVRACHARRPAATLVAQSWMRASSSHASDALRRKTFVRPTLKSAGSTPAAFIQPQMRAHASLALAGGADPEARRSARRIGAYRSAKFARLRRCAKP